MEASAESAVSAVSASSSSAVDPPLQVSIRGLYKIFGDNSEAMLEHVRAGMSKTDLLAEHGHVLGLEDINVDMRRGEITVIMGLSGSGKSTLIRHLNRLIEPTTGEILVDGQDVMKLSHDELRSLRQTKMSMVFQKFALLPHRTVVENAAMALRIRGGAGVESGLFPHRTVVDNVSSVLRARENGNSDSQRREAEKWLARVGLEGFEDRYPHQLSGGMQQRVGIARALTSNSDVMLMDEAFSALDPLIRTDMQDLLLELQVELHKTVVFITHDLDEALKIADHLVILKDGAIVQQGEPQEILLNPADPYIEDFVSDINRARVLRCCSVMEKGEFAGETFHGDVDHLANLESLIAVSGGDTARCYRVIADGKTVGRLDMRNLVKALVPRVSSTGERSVR